MTHAWLVKWGYVVSSMGSIFTQETFLVQDIFDNMDVGDVIPEKHYEIIADIMRCACDFRQRYIYYKDRGKVDANRPPHNFYPVPVRRNQRHIVHDLVVWRFLLDFGKVTGWSWAITRPRLPQIRTCAH